MSKFENWIESHSNKEFVEFHRILDIEKSDKYDKKIGFYISYVLRDRYSNKVRYVINAAISQNCSVSTSSCRRKPNVIFRNRRNLFIRKNIRCFFIIFS